ncbi:GDP-mannose 4,6-dehydratase [bacterium]|nr:GDP-mannose 4,6-dehydratase [bacterium]
MQVLITGGAGFIGSTLCEALIARGDAVTVIDNFDPYYDPAVKRRNLRLALESESLSLVEGDIRDAELVADAFKTAQPEAVVHLAALAGVRQSLADPISFNDVNVNGTLVVLEAARQYGKPRFVLASTSSVYGESPHIPYREDDPLLHCISPYGASKIACEKYGYIYHDVHDLDVTALRFFTAYGPRQRPDMAIHLFARAIIEGRELTLFGDGSTSRDYTYIGDIVAGVVSAIDHGRGFNLANLGHGTATPLIDLVRQIELECGAEARIKYLPEQPGDPRHTCADIGRVAELFGYAPQTSLEDGIKEFVGWLKTEVG